MTLEPVVMAQIAGRIDQVTDPLLELPGIREPAIHLALPYLLPIAGNAENTAATRHQRHPLQIIGKAAEQLLS